MLQAIPLEELQIVDPEKAKRKKDVATGKAPSTELTNDNPMSFVQNTVQRSGQLSYAERHLINLEAQEYDNLKIMESFNHVVPSKDACKNTELY